MIRTTVTVQRYTFSATGWDATGDAETATSDHMSPAEEYLEEIVETTSDLEPDVRADLAARLKEYHTNLTALGGRSPEQIWAGTGMVELIDDHEGPAYAFDDRPDLSDAMSWFGDGFERSELFAE